MTTMTKYEVERVRCSGCGAKLTIINDGSQGDEDFYCTHCTASGRKREVPILSLMIWTGAMFCIGFCAWFLLFFVARIVWWIYNSIT